MKEERILDSRIAEKIMGLVVFQFDEYGPVYEIHNELTPIPSYSTDIADAWQVVEKLVDEGKVFIVKGDGLRTGDYPLKWTVLCDNQPRTDAATAPLAICLAALKAVGVEVEP